MENQISQPNTILSTIGLCFSGGGYRAATFSLGVLRYLHRHELLDQLKALSTVSGGTVTGAYYADCLGQGISFDDFYSNYYGFLQKDELLGRAIDKLEDDSIWKEQTKRRSLINAFALAYEELLCTHTFEQLHQAAARDLIVCFNATDFSFGYAFRFQTGSGVFGNNPFRNSNLDKLKATTKVSDAIASSSCFPVGFEPMVFPDDYYDHQDENYKLLKTSEVFQEGVGIMDGGIVDNQGIGSIVNINKTLKKHPLDTIIIADVSSGKMVPWEPGEPATGSEKSVDQLIKGFLKLFSFRWYNWAILAVGIGLIAVNSLPMIIQTPIPFMDRFGGILVGAGATFMIAGLALSLVRGFLVKNAKKTLDTKIPRVLIDDILALGKLDINLIKQMIQDRLSSALSMLDYVFLNQIRRLNYNLLFQKPELSKITIAVGVTEFRDKNSKEYQTLADVSRIASATPTTLWWDEEDLKVNRQDCLVACGQFTLCFQLISFLEKQPASLITTKEKELLKELRNDFKRFQTDPFFMVKPD